MLRLLTLVALGTSVAHAAPNSKGKEPLYCPTKEGDTCVYESRVGDRSAGEYTEVVTAVETKGAEVRVVITSYLDGRHNYASTIAVTDDGLFLIARDGKETERSTLLRVPAKVGTKWHVHGETQCMVTKEEDVEVPAGKFRAIRVESVGDEPRTTLWFAPRVGLIKMAVVGSDRVEVLKEFKPGK